MELLGLIVVILLYVIILYFINKNKATELVKDLMRYAQVSINSGDLKKEFVKSAVSEFISGNQTTLPLSKTITKVVENKIDDIIESKVSEIKSEKIDLGSPIIANTILAERVLESDSKGLITVYGRVAGGGIKKTEWEIGANYVREIK